MSDELEIAGGICGGISAEWTTEREGGHKADFNQVLTTGVPWCTIIGMKTAISIPNEMFKEIEEITEECDCSRSQVFAMAIREFLERRRSKKLLESLNDAYQEAEAPEETRARQQAKTYHAKRVRKEPY